MPPANKAVLGLDVGDRRVGVSVASLIVRLPRPLVTLTRDDSFFETLQKLVEAENAEALVVGLPRGLDGQHTAQTGAIEAFTAELGRHSSLPIHLQDEAVTSKQAEAELKSRGKPYERSDIDALAATYILEDFLAEHKEPVA